MTKPLCKCTVWAAVDPFFCSSFQLWTFWTTHLTDDKGSISYLHNFHSCSSFVPSHSFIRSITSSEITSGYIEILSLTCFLQISVCQSQYTQLFIFNDCQTFSESLLNHSVQELKAGKIWAVCPVCIPRWYNQPSTDDTGQITVKGQEVRYQPHTLCLWLRIKMTYY